MWGVQVHGLVMAFLELAACYDALDVLNLACVELLLRMSGDRTGGHFAQWVAFVCARAERHAHRRGGGVVRRELEPLSTASCAPALPLPLW